MDAPPVGLAIALMFSLLAIVVPARAAPEAESGRIVVFADGDAHAYRAGDRLRGALVLASEPELGFVVVSTQNPARFTSDLRSQGVAHEADPLAASVAFVPWDPRASTQYSLPLIGAPAAWNLTRGDASVRLCVADTGVRPSHEDLAPRWAFGYDFVNGDSDPKDDHGHGTHVSGIAAAAIDNGIGVAGVANVSLLHAKVLNAAGQGAWSTVASGIRWCADQGAAVISVSIVGATGSKALQRAVDYAWGKGAILFAAAGNTGPCNNCIAYPAAYSNAVAVGCVNEYLQACSFSAKGPQLDLVAPGAAILSTHYAADNAYAYFSGTSQSTPLAAGAAALLKSAHSSWSNIQIRAALESTAQDLGASGKDTQFGAGLVRVDRAIL